MAVRLIRASSDVPNITNKDDTKMVRYAYGGYDGFVPNFGQDLSYTLNDLERLFTINSGKIVLQGWEVDVDEAGVQIPYSGTKRFYTVYLEVNVALNEASIKSVYNSGSYPEVDPGDDLTKSPNGTARKSLYRFKVENDRATLVFKDIFEIPYGKEAIASAREYAKSYTDKALSPILEGSTPVQYAHYAAGDYLKDGEKFEPIYDKLRSGLKATFEAFTLDIGLNQTIQAVSISETGIYVCVNSDGRTTVVAVTDLSSNAKGGVDNQTVEFYPHYDSERRIIRSTALRKVYLIVRL
jgi:hypothetical protein